MSFPSLPSVHGRKSLKTVATRDRSTVVGSGGHSQPGSIVQVALQPSPALLLPSSQPVSPGTIMPSPHAVLHGPPAAGQVGTAWQVAVQPSVRLVFLRSSHCSVPSWVPLLSVFPHTVFVQVERPA